MLFGGYTPIILAELSSVVRRASCIVRQHLKTNIQTSFSINILHLQFLNFTLSMTWHQGLRIIKLGQVEFPRWPPLLKIAEITKSIFLQNHWIFLAEFWHGVSMEHRYSEL